MRWHVCRCFHGCDPGGGGASRLRGDVVGAGAATSRANALPHALCGPRAMPNVASDELHRARSLVPRRRRLPCFAARARDQEGGPETGLCGAEVLMQGNRGHLLLSLRHQSELPQAEQGRGAVDPRGEALERRRGVLADKVEDVPPARQPNGPFGTEALQLVEQPTGRPEQRFPAGAPGLQRRPCHLARAWCRRNCRGGRGTGTTANISSAAATTTLRLAAGRLLEGPRR
mmetsp:Transcript_137309/g.347855  ORF Transcript_137309/g.347855 Transcript_137309/m.347855 type:complete len:230 (+) Transcript_137309:333-1022(+)